MANRSVSGSCIFFLALLPLRALGHDMSSMQMPGLYGPYDMTREASGTSWEPEAIPMQGQHWMTEQWTYMLHGFLNVGYIHPGGPRGKDQALTTNMLMFMAQHPFEEGSVGWRAMLSAEPVMGAKGYPLLLQTGETADGNTPLIDRQHPHDLFMELAITGNRQVADEVSVFGYAGLPGEPALGPTAFMHRLSGIDNPLAPIGHHWMDSTHITYGVLTTGIVWQNLKFEGSAFRGREPDQYHGDIEEPKLDSYSGRLSYNPRPSWSMQVSYGHLHSPEELFPQNNEDRATASLSFHRAWKNGWTATTAAWGRNWQETIDTLDAVLVESTLHFRNAHTLFTRYEFVQKDDLVAAVPIVTGFIQPTPARHPFRPDGSSTPFTLNIFGVHQWTAGYIYDFLRAAHSTWGLGGALTLSFLPQTLESFYDQTPFSYVLFLRAKLGGVSVSTPALHTPLEAI